jgi:hypothetical protein
MEVPYLSISSVWSLDDHVPVIDEIKVSVFSHLGDNVEVFLNNESEFFIHLSFFRLSFPFINVDDVPLLVKTIVSTIDSDVVVFSVLVSGDFHCLSSLVDNILVLVSKHLPPSAVSGSASQIV